MKETEIKNRLYSALALAEIVSRVSVNENGDVEDATNNGYDARIVNIYPKGMDYDDKENTQVFTLRLHMPEKKVEIISRKDRQATMYQLSEDDDTATFLYQAIDAVLQSFKHFDDLDSDDLTFKWLGD